MNNWDILQKELAKYKNTLVYDYDNTISLLTDVSDGVDDYYWQLQRIDGSTHLLSAVCTPEFLVDLLSPEDYSKVVDTWNEGVMAIDKFKQWIEIHTQNRLTTKDGE